MGDFCHRVGNIPPNSIAILLEPRSIEPLGYQWIENHPNVFRHIWTYDSKLLQLPQAHFLLWASLWCTADIPKTKGISIVSSDKRCCPLHDARIELAKYFDKGDKVDCFGTFRGNKEEYVEASKVSGEMASLVEQYKAAKALEEMDAMDMAKAKSAASTSNLSEAELARRAFNKLVRGQRPTDEERNAYRNVTGAPGCVLPRRYAADGSDPGQAQ